MLVAVSQGDIFRYGNDSTGFVLLIRYELKLITLLHHRWQEQTA
jgi:hypothetical protein